MWGSKFVKPIRGKWTHHGYMTTEELPVPTGSTLIAGTYPKGTWLAAKANHEFTAVLASGMAIGFTTQDLDAYGPTGNTAFFERAIGKIDRPIKIGSAISLRVMDAGSEVEFEGLGAAVPGNLVCTSGTGSIASADAPKTELSFMNGCIRKAQTGDIVQLLLLDASLTPEVVGNRRIRVEVVGSYVK